MDIDTNEQSLNININNVMGSDISSLKNNIIEKFFRSNKTEPKVFRVADNINVELIEAAISPTVVFSRKLKVNVTDCATFVGHRNSARAIR